MNGPVRHVALTIFGVFAVMIAMLTWVQAVDADRYRDDPRNLRTVVARAGAERGVIISADDGRVKRVTVNPVKDRLSAFSQDSRTLYIRQALQDPDNRSLWTSRVYAYPLDPFID